MARMARMDRSMPARMLGGPWPTFVLGAGLIAWMSLRAALPLEPTPVPPPFVVDVAGSSIGAEVAAAGAFWTIDRAPAELDVANTTDAPSTADVSMTIVDGPCATGRSLEITAPSGTRTVVVPPGRSVSVRLEPFDLAPLGRATIAVVDETEACPPVGADPRAISFQVYDLVVTAGTPAGA